MGHARCLGRRAWPGALEWRWQALFQGALFVSFGGACAGVPAVSVGEACSGCDGDVRDRWCVAALRRRRSAVEKERGKAASRCAQLRATVRVVFFLVLSLRSLIFETSPSALICAHLLSISNSEGKMQRRTPHPRVKFVVTHRVVWHFSKEFFTGKLGFC